MLVNASHLKGLVIRATDGELGTVDEFYFDDETWAIRYLIVNTGGWLGGRRVMISPFSVLNADWSAKRLDVALTQKQVKHSPNIDTHQSVSRRHEVEFLGYYGYPYYWEGPGVWGPFSSPRAMAEPIPASSGAIADRIASEPADSHLRSSNSVTGYSIDANDGEVGHLDGFVVDDEAWTIRYIEAATWNWWPGKKVLIAPTWIEWVSWADSTVRVALSRDVIKGSPEYIESVPVTREFEDRLYAYYGRPPYWLVESRTAASSPGF